jgi:hypothetical protein
MARSRSIPQVKTYQRGGPAEWLECCERMRTAAPDFLVALERLTAEEVAAAIESTQ